MNNIFMKGRKGFFAALLIGAALLFAAFPMEGSGDNGGGIPAASKYTLAPKLLGKWEFEWGNKYGSGVEKVTLTATKNKPGNFGTIEYEGGWGSDDGSYAGDIVWVEQFSETAGILIIEYWPGRESTWMSLATEESPSWKPHPLGYKFYGVYYLNYKGDGGPGTICFFANTNDQDPKAPYGWHGPTETQTLEQAKKKFTQGNLPDLLDLSVGDPQIKIK